MNSSANVLSVQALEDLKAALVRFGSETQESLNVAAQEIRRTLDWLAERQHYWRTEVRRRQEIVAQAQRALAACQASGSYDPKTGRASVPDCRAYETALLQAQVYMCEAEAELRNVQQWKHLVQQAAADYQRQAQRLAALLNSELPRATAMLGRKIATLQAYVGVSVPLGGSPPSTNAAFSTISPTQPVGNVFTTGMGLAALGVGVSGAAIAVIRSLAGNVKSVLGTEIGERLSAQVLRQEWQWQELPFEPPKHGFHCAFTASGLPLIVLEPKVNQQGNSAPANERIAALIRELELEQVPAVVAIVEAETGLVDVYYRPVRSEDWQLLREGVSLAEALAATSPASAHPESTGVTEQERGPEAIEGGFGGPERGG